MEIQTISNRYIKLSDLKMLLQTKHGSNFGIKELDDGYRIQLPQKLSDVRIHSMRPLALIPDIDCSQAEIHSLQKK
ncbi:hypothetical protein LTS15_000073 [Exophiala xenobiotica]|nr:hypothetical protein LTS15_000073 [Exophiala xenobiotica]